MRDRLSAEQAIRSMNKDGSSVYFDMFQDGGAVCYYCNGMYLLFSIPLYGGPESYEGIYHESGIDSLLDTAYSWP